MAKTTATQRKRRKQTLASMLYDKYIEGCHQNYHGNPAKAPKRWKRLWVRQHKFVLKARAAMRHNERIKLHASAWEGFKAEYPGLTDAELESRGFVKEPSQRTQPAKQGEKP